MDSLFFHPKVVHLPIALGLILPFLTLGLLIAWKRAWLPKRTLVIALILQSLLVASGAVAMQTGEADEDRVERVMSERPIETHEELAEVFVWTEVGVLGVLALGLLIPAEAVATALLSAAILGSAVGGILTVQVGEAGGALVYKHNAGAAYSQGTQPGSAEQTGEGGSFWLGGGGEGGDDDDDDHDDDHEVDEHDH